MKKQTKVRVIVLDGLDWQWCREHKDATRRLWMMAEEGCCARLEACAAPVTSDAVAALLSGRDVKLHWITDDRFSNSADLIRTRPWMYELAQHDMTLGLCNVPLTWPAFRMPKGSWMTSGYPVHLLPEQDRVGRAWHWPSSLEVFGYPIREVVADSNGGPGGSSDLEAICRYEREIVDWFVGGALRADVELIWLRSTDSAGHHAWGTDEYKRTVEHICELAHVLRQDAENVVVVSDHGFDAITSSRCAAYMATEHGPTTQQAKLGGAHTMDGILFASGRDIVARGQLVDQKILEVAAGIFTVLQVPPMPGMIDRCPEWAARTTKDDDELILNRMKRLGYA
jgi:hypothetical protein